MRVWSYVITTDLGSAPNYEGAAVTLAICKPRLRRGARPGDLVIGFNGSKLSRRPHSPRWAGIVTEVMPLEEYWEDPRFLSKRPGHSVVPDNIYCLEENRFRQVPNPIHDSSNVDTDLGGRNVLVFGEAWHFGGDGPDIPSFFGLHVPMNARRTEPLREIGNSEWKALRQWLDDHDHGLPRNALRSQSRCSARPRLSRGLRGSARQGC